MAKTETGWTQKPSAIQCFDDWFRREDFGDRDQLERCWANAQNVAARDRNADFEQLIRLRGTVKAEIHRQCAHCANGLGWTEDGRTHYGYEHQGVTGIVGCTASRELREALAPRRTGE